LTVRVGLHICQTSDEFNFRDTWGFRLINHWALLSVLTKQRQMTHQLAKNCQCLFAVRWCVIGEELTEVLPIS